MLKKFLVLGALLVASPAFASREDHTCLADVIYAEARGESRIGQIAVAEVVMNRVGKPDFANSVCGVVRQRGQFAPKVRVREAAAYETAKDIAEDVMNGETPKLTNGALYFHTPAVSPSWSKRFERTTRIGSHIFYKH